MRLKAVIFGLAFSISLFTYAGVRAANEPTSRHGSPQRAPREATLGVLYPHDDVLLWSGTPTAESRRTALLRLLDREHRLDPSVWPEGSAPQDGVDTSDRMSAARVDRRLSRAWLGYLARRRGSNDLPAAETVLRAMAVLERAEVGSQLRLAALELMIVQAVGGWRPVGTALESFPESVPLEAPEIASEEDVPRRRLVIDQAQLRRRLVQSMDLPAKYLEAQPSDAVLTQAIRRFQRRHGLTPDGVVGARTLAALREPVAEQLARIQLNLARAGDHASRAVLRRYVEVNIPAFELRLIQNGHVTLRSRVIVGDDKTPTPVFDDVIRFIDLDPMWYVPASIVQEVLDRERSEAGYLERAGFVWQTSEGGRPRLVQRPGPENALGRFKFVFPNHHAVYLHDTAQRGLFGRTDRALSHGCVRVERPAELALALLADQGWDPARLEQALATRRTRRIELVEPVPVFLDYRTVDLDAEGRLLLLADLYGLDSAARATAGVQSVFGRSMPRPGPADRTHAHRRVASAPTSASLD
jgi:hypothetical protein